MSTRVDVAVIAVPSSAAAATDRSPTARPARRIVCSSDGCAEIDLELLSRARADQPLDRLDHAHRADPELLRLVEDRLRVGLAEPIPRHDAAHQELARDLERVDGRDRAARRRAASARAPSPSASATRASARRSAREISVISCSTGAELDVLDRGAVVLRPSARRSRRGTPSTSRSLRSIAPASISVTSVSKPTSSCQNAISSNIISSRMLRADLADHPEVEEVQMRSSRLPHQVARVRVGVEEAVDQHLLVEGLEELLARPPCAARTLRRARIGTAGDVLHHEQPRRRVARRGSTGTASRVERAAITRASARCCAASLTEVELAAATTSTGARTRPAGRSPA